MADAKKIESAQYQTDSNGGDQQLRNKLLLFREELTDRFFAEVQDKLAEYTATPAYLERLSKSLTEYSGKLEGSYVILLRPADMKFKEQLAPLAGSAEFEADESIAVGGFKLRQDKRIYDETLDMQLAEERGRFLSYCGLNV